MPRIRGAVDVPPAKRVAVVVYLANRNIDGRPIRGSMKSAAAKFSVSRFKVGEIWKARHDTTALVAPCRPRPLGTGKKMSDQEVADRVQTVPRCERQTIRALSAATRIPTSTLHDYLSSKVLRRFISRVKPTLTPEHKRKRLEFALSHVQRPIDEKWFNLYRASTKYYLAADEQLPHWSSPNMRYIEKVMVLAAVARPRYDSRKRKCFDGEIEIWPIVEHVLAVRSSPNRPADTPITKSISMTREVYVKMLREKLFPAIRRKTHPIKIQQDNADPMFQSTMPTLSKLDSCRIRVVRQPPRSPNFNILDLGFFNSIQPLQYKRPTTAIDGLIATMLEAFQEVSYKTLDKCFMTLQKVMKTTIQHGGGNNFKLPRVQRKHMCGSVTPTSIALDAAVVENGHRMLGKLSKQ